MSRRTQSRTLLSTHASDILADPSIDDTVSLAPSSDQFDAVVKAAPIRAASSSTSIDLLLIMSVAECKEEGHNVRFATSDTRTFQVQSAMWQNL